jgi:hypothetical protein
VSDAGCGSGTLRLRRKIPLLFGEESLKTVCFDSLILSLIFAIFWVLMLVRFCAPPARLLSGTERLGSLKEHKGYRECWATR